MNIHELKQKYQQLRDCDPEHVNELLDFSKRAYIQNEISIDVYRNLVRELEAQGAKLPNQLEDNPLIGSN
nr:YppF family protein [Cytobacillus gottheilii]